MKEAYEVLIVGAGSAGLSAALALGRLRRQVLVCDDDRPRNEAAVAMNNFIGRDGTPPQALRRDARRDLEKYSTVEIQSTSVQAIEKTKAGFAALLASGQSVTAKKILLAYGIQDQLPALPGFRELWGHAVFHCPYCHGYEFQNRRLALMGNGAGVLHMLPLLLGLSDDVVLITNGPGGLTTEQREKIARNSVRIFESPVQQLIHTGGRLTAVEFKDGTQLSRDGLVLLPKLPFQMKSNFASTLGCELTEFGLLKVDDAGRTSVPGVYAAGDIARAAHSVLLAAAQGQFAGANITHELLSEAFL